MEFIIVLLLLVAFGFICFGIYLFLEVLQFIMQATNLYKDMIVRLDSMLKIMNDIRAIHLGNEPDLAQDVVKSSTLPPYNNIRSAKKVKFDAEGEALIMECKDKSDMLDSGICPACGTRTSRSLKKCASCFSDFSLFDPA